MAPPKGTTNNPGGKLQSTRQSRASLAAKARELLNDGDLMLDFYIIVASGKVPEFDKDKTGKITGVKAKEQGFGQTVTLDQQMLAMARIAERGWGQAAQHTVLEAEIRAEVQAIAGGIDTQYFKKLTPEALLAIKAAVKGLSAPAPQESPEAEDAEYKMLSSGVEQEEPEE